MFQKNKVVMTVAGLLFALVNIIWIYLATRSCFCYDEAYSIGLISQPVSDLVAITAQDVHPPLYYVLLRGFFLLCGKSYIATKLFSLIFMDAFLVLGFLYCNRKYSSGVALWFLGISMIMPIFFVQATTVRMYAFGLFFVSVTFYFLEKIYVSAEGLKKATFGLTVFTVLAMYTHTFCMLEMAVGYLVVLVILLIQKKYSLIKYYLTAGIAASVCFIPWLIVLWHQLMRWMGKESGWGNIISPLTLHSFVDYVVEWFSAVEKPNYLSVLLWMVFVVITMILGIRKIIAKKDFGPGVAILAAGITFVIAQIVSYFLVPCFMGRYLFPTFGWCVLVCAIGIDSIKPRVIKAALGLVVLATLVITVRTELSWEKEDGLAQYRQFVESNYDENTVIMCDSYFAQLFTIFYPEYHYLQYGSEPACMPFKDVDVFWQWEQLDGVDRVIYVYLTNLRCGNLYDEYELLDTINFDYSFYNIEAELLERTAE